MKQKMRKKDLVDETAISNAVMDVLSASDFTTDNTTLNKALILYHYYSELESGGHESLFRWFGQPIQAMGIDEYVSHLIDILGEINAHSYVSLEKKYCKALWQLYVALENEESAEDRFYHLLEEATNEYYKLHDELRGLVEKYFVSIYTDLIELVDD